MSHVNAHQRVASVMEDFNNQVAQITLSVESHLSLAPPVIFQRAHEWSGYGGSEGDYTWDQQREQPLSKAKLDTVTVEDPVCQQQKPTLRSWYKLSMDFTMATFSRLISQLFGGKSIIKNYVLYGSSALFLLE